MGIKEKKKITLDEQVNKLSSDLSDYMHFSNPSYIDGLIVYIESAIKNLDGEGINFIQLKAKIETEHRILKERVDNLGIIEKLAQRLESLQAEIEKGCLTMIPDEIRNYIDVQIIPKDVVEEINFLRNNINVQDIRQRASELFQKYEIAKKEIDAKAEKQELIEIENLEAKVKEEMFSKENNDKWGYVYRDYNGKITDLAPGTKKEVDLVNEYGICYKRACEPSIYCFCENILKENNLTPKQEYAIQKEKKIREKQLTDYKENPDKYSEIYIIPAIVKPPISYTTFKIDVHVTKGEVIEAGLNPDRLALQRESVSSKDIAESTKGIGNKLRNGLKNALNRLKNIGKDDKNNDGREEIE